MKSVYNQTMEVSVSALATDVSFVLKKVIKLKIVLILIDREVDILMVRENHILDVLSADLKYIRLKTAPIKTQDLQDIEKEHTPDLDQEVIEEEEDIILEIEIAAAIEIIPLLVVEVVIDAVQILEKDILVILVIVEDPIKIEDLIEEKVTEDLSVKAIQDLDLSPEVIKGIELLKTENQEMTDIIEEVAVIPPAEAEVDQEITEEM